MTNAFNLLFPEWQGYGVHQDVYHGAYHFCNHVTPSLNYTEVEVSLQDNLEQEGGILGRSLLYNMLNQASDLLQAANPSQIFMMGGTCACEIAPISFLNEQYDEDLAIFWFDAHGDLNTPETSPSHRMHGMPLRSLLGEGDPLILSKVERFVRTQQVALVGVRDLDQGEDAFIRRHKIPIFKIAQSSHTSALVDFIQSSGFSKAYIHFDLDVLEPSEFDHTLLQVPGGLSINRSIEAVQLIRKHVDVVGCSVVEYCPKDTSGDEQLKRLISQGMGVNI